MVHEFRRGFIGVIVHLLAGYAAAQALPTSPPSDRPAARASRAVTPEDLKKGKELDERFVKAAREGHWDDASVAAEELLALCKRTHGATHFETVTVFWRVQVVRSVRAMSKDDQAVMLSTNTFFGEAVSLEAQGKYAGAQPLRERMLEIDRRLLGDDHPTTAGSYCALASNLGFRGNFGEAQPLFEKALDVRRRLLGVNHPETAATYDLLALNLMEQGQYDAAQALMEKALVISRRLLGDQDTRTACIWNDLALILMQRGRYGAAQPLFERALAISRRLLGDGHGSTLTNYNNLASSLNAQGKYAEAQPIYEKTLLLRRTELGEQHPTVATSYNNLATNLQAQRKYSAAEPLFRKAIAINSTVWGDGHPNTTYCYNSFAQNLKAQGKFAEALAEWTRAAHSLELGRMKFNFAGLDRSVASLRDVPLLHLAALLARLGQFDAAWQRLEEAMARGLLDELAAREDDRLTPQERALMANLISELEKLDRLFEAPLSKPVPTDRQKQLDDLRGRHDRTKIALDELRSHLAKKYGPIAGKVAPLAEIQQVLSDDTALVAWVDILPVGAAVDLGEHWGVVVRARGTPAWFRLSGVGAGRQWTEADTKLAWLVGDALHQRPSSDGSAPGSLIRRLRAQRLDPLAVAFRATTDGLPAVRRLIVLPSENLAGVPIEALIEPGDSWTVSYAPSATVLAYLRGQPKIDRTRGLVALGDPVLERSRSPEGPGSLPGTRYEVEALGRLFASAHQPARIFTDHGASEPEMYQLASSGDLGRFAFIHLATHGLIDGTSPQRSAVVLTQTDLPDPLTQVLNKRPVYDGQLTVREIERDWRLNAEMVTLSACETARGQYVAGEGFVGFTQVLLMAGARTVCLSLWKVDDAATALLMERFYANLLAARPGLSMPLPKAEALAEAKRWLRALHRDEIAELTANLSGGDARSKDAPRRKPAPPANSTPPSLDENHPYAHPYYWSAFVLVGNPD